MKTHEIKFSKVYEMPDRYAPQPTSKFIPEWYKKIESRFPEKKHPESLRTVKKCIPFYDAMTAGYVIVSPCDVYVSMKDEEPFFTTGINELIQFHPRKQAYSHPKSNAYDFPKWMSPWAITTPKGYSCLFKPLSHNPNPWFEVLEGIVDTDDYNGAINFPFILLDPEKEFLIPAGTPIAQIIPFKRESWKIKIDNDDTRHREVNNLITTQFFDRYKRMFWKRKEYN